MLNSVQQNLVTTISSAQDLNSKQVQHELTALLTLVVLISMTVFFICLSYHLDSRHMKSSFMNKINPLEDSFDVIQIMDNRFEKMFDDSLPRILSSSKPQLIEEFKQHHKWLCVIFHFSESCPRSLRVLSLATNVAIVIFIQSIIYNLANPDDGSCKSLTSMESCEKLRSQLNMKEHQCIWETNLMLNNGGRCSFNESSFSWTVVIFVTLFSAVSSTPIALFLDYVIFGILAVKIESGTGMKKSEERIKNSRIIINRQRRIEHDYMLIFHHFKALSDEILLHRENLSRRELAEFDSKF
jgi:hypothetical protein